MDKMFSSSNLSNLSNKGINALGGGLDFVKKKIKQVIDENQTSNTSCESVIVLYHIQGDRQIQQEDSPNCYSIPLPPEEIRLHHVYKYFPIKQGKFHFRFRMGDSQNHFYADILDHSSRIPINPSNEIIIKVLPILSVSASVKYTGGHKSTCTTSPSPIITHPSHQTSSKPTPPNNAASSSPIPPNSSSSTLSELEDQFRGMNREEIKMHHHNLIQQRADQAVQNNIARRENEKKILTEKIDLEQELRVEMDSWSHMSSGEVKDLRTLLSTMHTVLWQGANWKAVSLSDLMLNENLAKTSLKRATLLCHPDKLSNEPVETQVRASKIFQALMLASKKTA